MDFEEHTATDRFVWCDPNGYKKLQRRGAVIFAAAVLCGVVPYYAGLYHFIEGKGLSIVLGAIVALILLWVFRKRLFCNMATFIRYEGMFYRVSDANRGITRIAEDNGREAPYFEADFRRARKGNTCWRILEVEDVREQGKSVCVTCKICKSKSGKESHKDFYIEDGYLNQGSLLDEFKGRLPQGTQN